MALYARETVVYLGVEYHAGDELPELRVAEGVDANGQHYITDQFGRHWKVTHGSGHPTAELDPTYSPNAAGRELDPEHRTGLVARGLATTDADEAAVLWDIRELETQRNAETAEVVDAQIADLRARLPRD